MELAADPGRHGLGMALYGIGVYSSLTTTSRPSYKKEALEVIAHR
jgi:hypothetical protein